MRVRDLKLQSLSPPLRGGMLVKVVDLIAGTHLLTVVTMVTLLLLLTSHPMPSLSVCKPKQKLRCPCGLLMSLRILDRCGKLLYVADF